MDYIQEIVFLFLLDVFAGSGCHIRLFRVSTGGAGGSPKS
jgi:hypothetical protein